MNAENLPGEPAKATGPLTAKQPTAKTAVSSATQKQASMSEKPESEKMATKPAATKPAEKPAAKKPVGKKVELRLVYINFWSALKLSFLVGIGVAVTTLVLFFVLQIVLDVTGLVGVLDEFAEMLTDGTILASTFLNMQQVMTFAFVAAVINFVAVTVIGALVAGLYNMVVKITGGLTVGFIPR